MATEYTATEISSGAPIPNARSANDLLAVRKAHTITAAIVINDTFILGVIPANHVLVDAILDCDDLDTNGTPLVVLDLGVAADADAIINASDVGQAGGLARMNVVEGIRLTPTASDTNVILTASTAPATSVTSGTIGLTLITRIKTVDD